MKYGIILLMMCSSAFGEVFKKEVPVELQCANSKELRIILEKKYGEQQVIHGSSGIDVGQYKGSMSFFTNPSTRTFTYVLDFHKAGVSCVIDSGKIDLKEIPQTSNTTQL